MLGVSCCLGEGLALGRVGRKLDIGVLSLGFGKNITHFGLN